MSSPTSPTPHRNEPNPSGPQPLLTEEDFRVAEVAARANVAIPERILEDLNPRQRAAVEALEGPVLVVAGAGSGKTRVLTRRVAALVATGVEPQNILAITFTNKAAAEMRERVAHLVGGSALDRMWVSTFHSACVRMLRMKGPTRWFSIADQTDAVRILRGVLEEAGYDGDRLNMGFVRRVHSHISRAKNNLRVPQADGTPEGDAAAKLFGAYQQALQAIRAYDFDDLLVETVRMLRENPEAKEFFSDLFRYILIDEYQDTNRAQYAIVRELASKWRNICVVGDPDQSVYSFRGADPTNLLSFEKDWPDAKVVVLDQNYRSTQWILRAAQSIIEGNEAKHRAKLWTEGEEGEKVRMHEARDDRDEAEWVAKRIKSVGEFGDHAILYRANAQSRVLEEALRAHRIPYTLVGGVRFYDRAEIRDAIAYLRFAVNPADMMSFQRIVNTPRRGIGQVALEKIMVVADSTGNDLYEACVLAADPEIGERAAGAIGRFGAFMEKVREAAHNEGPVAALEVVLLGIDGGRATYRSKLAAGETAMEAVFAAMGKTGQAAMYLKSGAAEGRDRVNNLIELARSAEVFCTGPAPATLATGGLVADLTPREQTEAFLEHVTLVSDLDTAMEEGQGAVVLATLHSAKGLEFPHVTIVGMDDGLLPLKFGSGYLSRAEMAEERRLAYVGVTRAQKTLALTRAAQRMMFGRIDRYAPSPFWRNIQESLSVDITRSSGHMGSFGSSAGRFGSTYGNRERRGGFEGGQRRRNGGRRPSDVDDAVLTSTRVTESGEFAPDPPKPASLDEVGTFEPGDRVVHSKWGLGVVTKVGGTDSDPEVWVDFQVEGEKRLLARFAKLKKL